MAKHKSKFIQKGQRMTKILVSVALLVSAVLAADIEVSDIVVKQTPPRAKNTAIFLTIANNSDKDIALVDAESDLSDNVELHSVVYEGEKMTMVKVPEIAIKAKSSVQLMSGAEHIMLFGIKKPVTKDTKANLTLHFSNGESLEFKDIQSVQITGMGLNRQNKMGQGRGGGMGQGAGRGQNRPCQDGSTPPCMR